MSPSDLKNTVEGFVAGAGQPALLDEGEEPLALIPQQWSVSEWNSRVVLQAWHGSRNLVRKILRLKEKRADRICLIVERFPKSEGELQIADLASPLGRDLERRTSRHAFRERFYLMLAREFPDWNIEELSSEPNLEESLSAAYTRGFLRMGTAGMAVMGAAPGAECTGMCAFGLIWLYYLRKREKPLSIGKLLLFVPIGSEKDIVFRASYLDPRAVVCQVFAFDEKDRAGQIDFADEGNLESVLPPCRRPELPNADHESFPEIPDVDRIEQSDGSIRFQVRGLEFARSVGGKLSCGIAKRRRAGMETIRAMAAEIARVRNPEAADRQHPLYSLSPEGWLESQVRAHPEAIDASLRPVPIYGQVPMFSAGERGVIDLLGIDHTGRLVVIELKATADLQLPFQALDYWLRVRRHLLAGDFERLGYFAGHLISRESPRILLVAPALEFHSTTETLLAAFSPATDITRIGLAADWRSELRVMFRLRGSEKPG